MKILAIETSCDDTCAAILKVKENKFPGFQILSNIVSSQVKIHKKWGGVYPFLAKREHQRNLAPVLKKALEEARLLNSKCKMQNAKLQFKIQNLNLNKTLSRKIDLIAVTVGPGLEPCLWVGINFAKALNEAWKKPIIPINHIEAHIYANFLSLSEEIKNLKLKTESPTKFWWGTRGKMRTEFSSPMKNYFPAVCLVVSGGHTQLILMTDFGDYKILGETRDDAAGECFDKVARILGLGYPGGPAIAAEASKLGRERVSISLPRPMIYQKNYDFSFAGLKTAVLYKVKSEKRKAKSEEYVRAMAAEVQQAIIDVLIHKTMLAAKEYKAKSIILGGGVAANNELKGQFKDRIKKEIPNSLFLIPDSQFCTDNAVMVAVTAYFNRQKKKSWKKITANANLRIN